LSVVLLHSRKLAELLFLKKKIKKLINRCAAGFAPHRQTVRPLRKSLLREMAALNNFNNETESAGCNWLNSIYLGGGGNAGRVKSI